MSQFKAGNTVRFKDESGAGHSKSVQHKLYTVVDIFGGDLIDLSGGVTVMDSRLELVSEEPLPFTTGDKAVVLTTGHQYTTYCKAANAMGLTRYMNANTLKAGDIVTVKSAFLHENNSYGVLYGIETEDGNQYVIGARGIEKYVEPVAPAYPTFNVGDRVKVKPIAVHDEAYATILDYEGYNNVVSEMVAVVGQVFTVERIGHSGYSLNDGTGCRYMPQWLELYTPTPLEEAQEEIERLKKVLDKKDAELLEVRTLIGQATEILSEI